MSEEKFEWTDDNVIDFHKKYMGSESHNIHNYLKQFKQSKLKDWEIVSYKTGDNIWYVRDYGKTWVIDTSNMDINSLKRLSDGEVFSLQQETNKGLITGIDIGLNGVLYFTCKKDEQTDYGVTIDMLSNQPLFDKDWEIINGGFMPPDMKPVISSVRRISDGEVISVGDYINDGYTTMKVENIKIEYDSIVLVGNIGNMQLRFAKKQKQPLFKTDDGLDIYEKDAWPVFKVDEKFQILKFSACDAEPSIHPKSKYFSTEQAAKDYIIMNKPCLSINKILMYYPEEVCIPFVTIEHLKIYVEQMIN